MKCIYNLFHIHGKLSKKSKLTHRVRNAKQQCYILNHSIPNSSAQLANQSVFGKVSAIVNRIEKDHEQIAYWESIAALSDIADYTWRKVAYAYYKEAIISQQQAQNIAIDTTAHQTQ